VALGPVDVGLGHRAGLQAVVDIAGEGQQRRLAVVRPEAQRPGLEALRVELGQRRGDAHQFAERLSRQVAQQADQRLRPRHEGGLAGAGEQRLGHRGLEVQGLGGRDQQQHGNDYRQRSHNGDAVGQARNGP
jgi:hypothetical protein